MLVLTRREGESIVIPRSLIRVTVTRIDGNRVRLGFETPTGHHVLREELLERKFYPGEETEVIKSERSTKN